MPTRELRGGLMAGAIKENIKKEVELFKERGVFPRLVAVLAGSDQSILSYLDVKRRVAEKLGILLEVVALPQDVSQEELRRKIIALGEDDNVHGMILELPLPNGLDIEKAIEAIPQKKDVDGLTSQNLGLLIAGRESESLISATAQACVLLAEGVTDLKGKNVAVVGKGRTVGRPLIPMLLNRGATLTVCHSGTVDLKKAIQSAEIVFLGVGKPGVLNSGNLAPGQIIIDAGTSFKDGKLMGDADLDIWGIAEAASPVPDGVGPLTTALVFSNLIKAIKLQNK